MRRLDLPNVWLLLAASASWAIGWWSPDGLGLGAPWVRALGLLLIAGGLAFAHLALRELRRAGTSPQPGCEPARLVVTGPFRVSRNPTYLGMVLAALGFVLSLDAPLALPVVALLALVLDHRHVRPEEDRLRRHFPTEFERYRAATRRWL